jgi:hypothetical protein
MEGPPVTSARADRVRELLHADLPGMFDLIEVSDERWLELFPGGFTPIARVADGEFFEYDPERIASWGEALTDEQFDAFLAAIVSWQRQTLMDFMLQLGGESIALKYLSDHPHEGGLLTIMAGRAGLPLTPFIGANRGVNPD